MANYMKNVNGVDIEMNDEQMAFRVAEEKAFEDKKPAKAFSGLRSKRNTLLTESDWTQYNDSPLTDEVKAEWAVHRQALRDLPANTDDPSNPTWPTPPG